MSEIELLTKIERCIDVRVALLKAAGLKEEANPNKLESIKALCRINGELDALFYVRKCLYG
jgi:hypothetical protein